MPRVNPDVVVGVTGPEQGGWPAWVFTRAALARAGVRAVRVTPVSCRPRERLHGLVVGGGADIILPQAEAPVERPWPEKPSLRDAVTTVASVVAAPLLLVVRWLGAAWLARDESDERRDALELELLRRADEARLPLLGICRGAQLLNLARGGSLLFNIQQFYEERAELRTVFPRRRVHVEPGSVLHRVVQQPELAVNSMHHHAAGEVPPSLRVVAREPEGVVQAIEDPTRAFFLGVQWHPEYLPQLDAQAQLFEALATEARAVAEAGKGIHCPRADELPTTTPPGLAHALPQASSRPL